MLLTRLFGKKKHLYLISKLVSLKVVQFHLTHRCNLKCKFCWKCDDNKKIQEELPNKRVLELTEEACLLRPGKFIISGGGEPLMRKDVVSQMIPLIKDNEIKGELITNGTLIDPSFARILVDSNWDEVEFSVQSPFKNIDESLRGVPNSFSESINGIKAIAKQKWKSKSNKPRLTFKTVLNKNNYKHLYQILRLAKKLKMNGVQVRLITKDNQFCEGLMLGNEEKLYLLRQIKKYKKYYKTDFLSTEFSLSELETKNNEDVKNDTSDKRNKSFCAVPFHELLICPDGTTFPCCGFFGYQFEKEPAKLEMADSAI